MEKSLLVIEDSQGKIYQNGLMKSGCEDMQQSSSVSANGLSDFDLEKDGNELVHEEDSQGKLEERLERLNTEADRDYKKEPESTEQSYRTELDRKDDTTEWGIDKNLPPIKTRRDSSESPECSPSDLSPPSPKRMRPGSKERTEDQLHELWDDRTKLGCDHM